MPNVLPEISNVINRIQCVEVPAETVWVEVISSFGGCAFELIDEILERKEYSPCSSAPSLSGNGLRISET